MGGRAITVGVDSWEIGATALGTVTLDGHELTRTQRTIVAALAFGVPGTVTTDQLIDAVWIDRVPRAARASLQNQITRLRRQFGTDVVETTGAGYRLGRTSDVAVFEHLVTTALGVGPLPGSAGHRRIVDLLEAATSLWNGEPFGELIDVAGADAERARLGTLHATACEQLARTRIALGEHGDAIASLSALVEDEPYREQLWELFVTALALDGRRGEALAAHRRITERLQTDLGVGPCDELQLLRRRLEEGDLGRFQAGATAPHVTHVTRNRCAYEPLRRRARCAA